MNSFPVFETDIAVIGGGLGGVAAAMAACEEGATVLMSEATAWIGGQVTSQLVSALDEHPYIETFGGTRSYYRFREQIRRRYQERCGMPAQMPDGAPLNPGNGWVSALCFEPRIGLNVLNEFLAPYKKSGQLAVLTGFHPTSARTENGHLREVTLSGLKHGTASVRAEYFLDATEMGDLLSLAGVPYSSGAEAWEETYEPNASRDGAHPERVQAFTTCFLVEHCPGEDHTIHKPRAYERWRDSQPFGLDVPGESGGVPVHYPVFSPLFPGQRTFWTYRRLVDTGLMRKNARRRDLALINWDSHDYRGGSLIDQPEDVQMHRLREARELSKSFLYWLQTEAQRDDGSGFGYPGLRLVPHAAGTWDGLAMAPYIRESRRIRGLAQVREQDIVSSTQNSGTRARPFIDSIGVGWYPIDVHACAGGPYPVPRFAPSLPYQIPLGALISPALSNLLAAAKNISCTHITNGAYRLHPVEWNIGEAAGRLAACCLNWGKTPAAVHSNRSLLPKFQALLLERGMPLSWALDVKPGSENFHPLQACLTAAPLLAGDQRYMRLEVHPDEPVTRQEVEAMLKAAINPAIEIPVDATEIIPGTLLRKICMKYSLPVSSLGDVPSYREVACLLAPYLTGQG